MAADAKVVLKNDVDGYLTTAQDVKGSLLTFATIEERDAMLTSPQVASLVNGSTCYVASTDMFYTWDGISWGDGKIENTANKVALLSSESTNAQYPSAKAVYDGANVAIVQNAVTNGGIGYTTSTGGKAYTITWNGDRTGKTPAATSYDLELSYYPISSLHPNHVNLIGATGKWSDGTTEFTVAESDIEYWGDEFPVYWITTEYESEHETWITAACLLIEEEFESYGSTYLPGIYFGYDEEGAVPGRYLQSFHYEESVVITDHKIANKYMSDTVISHMNDTSIHVAGAIKTSITTLDNSIQNEGIGYTTTSDNNTAVNHKIASKYLPSDICAFPKVTSITAWNQFCPLGKVSSNQTYYLPDPPSEFNYSLTIHLTFKTAANGLFATFTAPTNCYLVTDDDSGRTSSSTFSLAVDTLYEFSIAYSFTDSNNHHYFSIVKHDQFLGDIS